MFRRVDIQADNIANLFDQQRVGRQFEGLAPVWLQAEGAPYTTDRHVAVARRLRHRSCTPMSRAPRRAFQSSDDNVFDFLIVDLPRCAGTWFVQQSGHTFGNEARPPFPYCRWRYSQSSCYLAIILALGAGQYDARSSSQCRRRSRTMCHRFQFLSFRFCKYQKRFRSAGSHLQIVLSSAIRFSLVIYYRYFCYRTL